MFLYGVIALVVTFMAMIGYFMWLAYKDPANLFRRPPRDDDKAD